MQHLVMSTMKKTRNNKKGVELDSEGWISLSAQRERISVETAVSPPSLHSRAREYLLIQRDECYNPIDKIAWPVVEGIHEGEPRL
jgi:hypothetical protein